MNSINELSTNLSQIIFDLDTEIIYSKEIIKFDKSQIKLYRSARRIADKRKYVQATVELQLFENYLDELRVRKDEILKYFIAFLSRYNPNIFSFAYQFYCLKKNINEIFNSQTTSNYTIEEITRFINEIGKEIMEHYICN